MNKRFKYYGCLVLLLAANLSAGLALAQESQPEVDYNEEQYAAYQEAVSEPDLAERQKKIVAFVKTYPDISLVKYAMQSLREIVATYYQQQQWSQAIDAAKTWLELEPDAAAAHGLIAEAAFRLQDFKTAAEHGEIFYQSQPSPQMAFYLAIAYQQLNDQAKFEKYGRIVIDSTEPKDYLDGHLRILIALRGAAAQKEDWPAAAEYSRKILSGLDQAKLPANWTPDIVAKQKTLCYAFFGRHAFELGRWNDAISNYHNVIAGASDRNLKAESFYYIGLSHWREGKLDPAMRAFAKGSLLSGTPHQDACRQYLVTLYKSTHNDSTAGLDEYMERISKP